MVLLSASSTDLQKLWFSSETAVQAVKGLVSARSGSLPAQGISTEPAEVDTLLIVRTAAAVALESSA